MTGCLVVNEIRGKDAVTLADCHAVDASEGRIFAKTAEFLVKMFVGC
jgi:hypothetical protein